MAKNEQNLRKSEEFLRQVTAKYFNQSIDDDSLRQAAKKLCEAIPSSHARKNQPHTADGCA